MSIQESFIVPDHAELIVVTHVLELPTDLGLPSPLTHLIVQPRDDVFVGSPDEAMAAFVGVPALPRPNVSPDTRITFRRTYAPDRPYLWAAMGAFDDWLEGLADPGLLDVFRTPRLLDPPPGTFAWVTVAAATRFIAASPWPSEPADQSRLLGSELDSCLRTLNNFLSALSLARGDPTLRPVARGDLPPLCPVILETAPMPDGVRNGVAYLYQIHGNYRFPQRPDRGSGPLDDDERLAIELTRSTFHGNQPYFLFYELMQAAIREFNSARFDAAAISTGTAVEVLFSTTIREAGAARGQPAHQYEAVLEYPLRNQIEHHLSKYVGCEVDLNDSANSFGSWWNGGYQLRNKVVHVGYRPSRDEAEQSLDQATKLIQTIRAGLLGDALTENVGGLLEWGRRDKASTSDADLNADHGTESA